MSNPPLPARRYSDEEVARLIQRATELQGNDPVQSGREGMTLAELESIAREAGIDPTLLRHAANELDRQPAQGGIGTALLGESTTLLIDRVYPGALDNERLEELVPLINAAANSTGQVSMVGRTLNFSSTGGGNHPRTIQVMVTSRNGETQLHIEERYGQIAGALFGGLLGGGGGGLGLGVGLALGQSLGSLALSVGLPLAFLGGFYGLARTIFRAVVRKRRLALTRLAEQVESAVSMYGTVPDELGDSDGSTPRLPPGR